MMPKASNVPQMFGIVSFTGFDLVTCSHGTKLTEDKFSLFDAGTSWEVTSRRSHSGFKRRGRSWEWRSIRHSGFSVRRARGTARGQTSGRSPTARSQAANLTMNCDPNPESTNNHDYCLPCFSIPVLSIFACYQRLKILIPFLHLT